MIDPHLDDDPADATLSPSRRPWLVRKNAMIRSPAPRGPRRDSSCPRPSKPLVPEHNPYLGPLAAVIRESVRAERRIRRWAKRAASSSRPGAVSTTIKTSNGG